MLTIKIIALVIVILLIVHMSCINYCYKHKVPIHILIPIWTNVIFVIRYEYVASLDDEAVIFSGGFLIRK